MPAPISVVIPTLNAAGTLPKTAAALMPGLTVGLIGELIISDGGSADATLQVARDLGAVVTTGAAGRGAQIARGVAKAREPWLLILHADTRLSRPWVEAAQDHILHHPGKAGFFRLAFESPKIAARAVEIGGNWRARRLGRPWGDQGLLISRDLLDEIGGIPDLPLMEDVALAGALKGRLRALDATALTSPDRYERDGWVRRVLGNLRLQALYRIGVPVDRLRRDYDRFSSEN